jgi:hypothetical protein
VLSSTVSCTYAIVLENNQLC